MKSLLNKITEYQKALIFFTILIIIIFLPIILNWQTFFSANPGIPLISGSYDHKSMRIPWNMDQTLWMGYEVPQTIYLARELRNGFLPLWNSYQGNGYPFSSSLTSGVYIPLKLLLFSLFPFFKTFDYYLLLRLFIAGFGSYLFFKKINLDQKSSLLGGVAFMLSGYFILWITHYSLAADMMLPWILLAIEHIRQKTNFKNALFLGLIWATMVLSGAPEPVVVVSLFSAVYFLYRTYCDRCNLWRKLGVYFTIALVMAAIISLLLLWDIAFYFASGVDVHAGSVFVEEYQMTTYLERFLKIFTLPVSPLTFFEVANLGGLWRGGFVEPYLGVFTFLLAIAALCLKNKKENKEQFSLILFLVGTILFFILIWIGIPPIIWIKKLPLIDKVIFFKYNSPFYFAFAALSAIGFTGLRKDNVNKKVFWTTLVILLILMSSLLIFSDTYRSFYKLSFESVRLAKINNQLISMTVFLQKAINWIIYYPHSYMLIIFGVAFSWLILFAICWQKKAYNFIFFFLILELFIYMPKLREGFYFGKDKYEPFKEAPFISYLKSLPDINNYRMFPVGRLLEPQTSLVYKLKDARIVESVLLPSYEKFLEPFLAGGYLKNPYNSWYTGTIERINKENNYFLPSFNAASVKYIISGEPLLKDAPYKLIYDQEAKIYENSNALPLAYFKIDNGNILKNVVIASHEPNKIILKTNISEEGTLILTETYYLGWRVFVDGKEEELLFIDDMFKGVRLSKGTHEITFKYWPFTKETLKGIFLFGNFRH